ncbi:MAG: hypothetical protein K8T89_20050 [Planctomycetes bacterium]|nr:hypothetical protein [Planctomycetota bacterium]
MSRRAKVWFISLAAVAGLAAYLLTCTFLSAWVIGLGKGSPAYAEKWRARLAAIPDPDAALAAYPEVEVVRCTNGEWVMGVSYDSHRSNWGGTVVVRESTGRVRAFFGHVCGPRILTTMGLSSRMGRAPSTLAEFYADPGWVAFDSKEYSFE